MHTARLRVELEQSRKEQKDYLHQVELARVLDKRKERKRKAAEAKGETVPDEDLLPAPKKARRFNEEKTLQKRKTPEGAPAEDTAHLKAVLSSVF